MSVGLGFLRKLIIDAIPVSKLSDYGVRKEDFEKDEITVLEVVSDLFRSYGKMPELATVERLSGVKLDFPDEPIDFWADGVRERALSRMVVGATEEVMDRLKEGDLGEVRTILQDLVLSFDSRNPEESVVEFGDAAKDVLEFHDDRQSAGRMFGIPFGFPYLDELSDGAQPGDTIAVVGRPSEGKSYVLLKMALEAHRSGKVPLVVTMEMSVLQCARRVLAMRTGVPASMIRLGRLGAFARKKIVADISELDRKYDNSFYFFRGSLKSTVDDLVLRVQELKPDVLYVDGAYMLRVRSAAGKARWERIAEAAETLKMIASDFNIPVIATYQFNRKGPGSLAHIGGADVISQLASIVISIETEGESTDTGLISWPARQYKIFELLKGREGERGKIRVCFDMQRMKLEQDSVITELD